MTCKEKTRNTPSGLTIESSLKSNTGVCKVPSAGSEHLVTVANCGPIAYDVAIHAECETSSIRFVESNAVKPTWQRTVHISWRPGKGGKAKRQEKCAVTSLAAGTAESIRTDTTVTASGWPHSNKESTWIQVEAL